jgi:hypothetical protein
VVLALALASERVGPAVLLPDGGEEPVPTWLTPVDPVAVFPPPI